MSSSGVPAQSVTTFDTELDIYGPILIGSLLSCLLYGMFLVALIAHYSTGPKHHWGLNTFFTVNTSVRPAYEQVLTLIVSLDTALACSRVVRICAQHAGDLAYFLDIKTRVGDWLNPLCSNLTAVLVQGFMAYRIITFSLAMRTTFGRKMRILFLGSIPILVLGVLFSLACALLPPIHFLQISSFTDMFDLQSHAYKPEFKLVCNMQFGSFLVLDLMISGLMLIQLRAVRTGFTMSNAVLDALSFIVFRTGVVVTTFQTVQFITFNTSLEAWADLPVVFMSKTYALTALALVAAPREIHRQHMKRMDEENRLGPSGDVAQAPLRACQCQERGATPRSIAASHSLEDQCGAPDVKFGQAHLAIAGVARSAEGSPATRGTIVASTLIPSPRSAQIAPPPLRSVPYEIEIGPYRYAKRAAAAYSKQRQCRTAESYPPARARWGRWAEDGDERAVKDTGRLSFREFMGLDEYDYDHCHEMEKQEIVEMEDTFPSLPAAGLQTRQPWYIGRLPSSTDEAEPGTVATSRLRIRDSLPLVSGADHRKVSYTVLW